MTGANGDAGLPVGMSRSTAFKSNSAIARYGRSLGAEAFAVCKRVANGAPQFPAIVKSCCRCNAEVWQSRRREDGFTNICYECKAELEAQD